MTSKVVFQNQPYMEGPRDKVMLIRRQDVGPYIYPTPAIGMDTSDISYVYLSTEEFTSSSYDLAPGSRFEPADYHEGDEVYVVLEGTLTMLNCNVGQVVEVKAGEGLLMPMGAPHIGYNFTQEKTHTMAFLAPKIFANQGFPTDTVGRFKIYKGARNDQFKKVIMNELPNRPGVLDDLGAWPVDGPTSRIDPIFYHLPEDKKLLAIAGQDNPVLMKFIVSNDFLTVAQMVIPSGGVGARKTDPDKHAGDCVIYMHEGVLSVLIHDTGETFQIGPKEELFIPKNTTYQLFNYESNTLHPLFCAVKL
jgi:gentisate 1,2-dioxygenase